jgi:hypothetical protein
MWADGNRDLFAARDEDILILNPLNAQLNPICHQLALLGAHHILHISRVRVTNVRNYLPSDSA